MAPNRLRVGWLLLAGLGIALVAWPGASSGVLDSLGRLLYAVYPLVLLVLFGALALRLLSRVE